MHFFACKGKNISANSTDYFANFAASLKKFLWCTVKAKNAVHPDLINFSARVEKKMGYEFWSDPASKVVQVILECYVWEKKWFAECKNKT